MTHDASSPNPLKTAVIGCGALARLQHLPNIHASDRLELHACCDPDPAVLEACRRQYAPARLFTDYKQVFSDPQVELIVLATTEKLRLPVIELAAEHDIPIYVEKPIATSLTEAYAIQKVVKQAMLPFCMGHNRRSSPAMMDAHAMFTRHMCQPQPTGWRWNREGDKRPSLPEDGAAGMSVRINDDWHSWKSWVFDKTQAPLGSMLFEMTHFTDICNWFMESQPVEVVALQAGMLTHGVVIRYANHALASIFMSANGSFGYPKELYECFGQGGVVVIDHMLEIRTAGLVDQPTRRVYPCLNDHHPQAGQEGGLAGWLAKKNLANSEAAASHDPMRQFTAEPDKGHGAHLHRFADEIERHGPVVCGVDETILATRVAMAAIRSAHEKRSITLDEI